MNYINILFYLALYLIPLTTIAEESHADAPTIKTAQDSIDDPYYPYVKRPLLSPSDEAIKNRSAQKVYHMPWTLLPPEKSEAPDNIKLKDIIIDRIKDQKTGKNYIKLYHGTTSDLENIFKDGAKAIKFSVAEGTYLGMGFYLAANINEAKDYACVRLALRKNISPDIKGMLLVVGIPEDEDIQGKVVNPNDIRARYSDNKTGESLDKNIFYLRNRVRYNQFVFFNNIAPHLKIFEIIKLPQGFGKSRNWQDKDGLPITSTEPDTDQALRCVY